ncbi:ComF family protein [uncultured Psychroserpens sp.]|uniref:ComF family protein n=1 Tax=uncultured Psychroserpens sp. TaxID=255436 RepID=UPI00261A075D|nr:phosphoribosyltransferase family protein [uncultured Psychroserpens sp.]
MVINLLNLFFPKVCLSCNNHLSDNERHICTSCRHQLPLTNFHLDPSNAVHKVMYGRVKLEQATALLHFSKKGIVQQLIHNLKYRGHQEIGQFLGEWLGEELKQYSEYLKVDIVVPVPLHKSKLKKRGYNQVEKFGKAIAKALNADYNPELLIKTSATKTQVFKDRFMRSSDTHPKFAITKSESLASKHILIVDDIITTGATLEACANTFSTIDGLKLSIATMAITD